MLPYDAVTARSGASAFKDARKAGSDAFSGVSSLSGKSPRASASSDTGDGGAGSDRRELRLRRHSGCDTTAATSKPSAPLVNVVSCPGFCSGGSWLRMLAMNPSDPMLAVPTTWPGMLKPVPPDGPTV